MVVLIIVIIAILCLCGIGINSFYQQNKKKNPTSPPQTREKSHFNTSIIGESRFHLSQMMPNDATPKESEDNVNENITEDSTFVLAGESEYDSEPLDVDAPELELEPPEEDNDPNEEEEEITEVFGTDAVLASGVSVEEMFQTNKVIEDTDATPKEEQQAGRILSQNEKTDMFEQLASGSPKRLDRIRDLMYIHEKKHNVTEQAEPQPQGKVDFKDFDINQFVR